jgi:hypothetical protein
MLTDNIPKNLDEAIAYLEARLTNEDREKLKTADMAQFHFTTGMNMRNSWGLWSGSPLKQWFNSIGIEHADDMSGIIMKAFRRKILGYPYDLQEDVKHYQEFWKRSKERESKYLVNVQMKVTKNKYGETEIEYINIPHVW